MSVNPTDKGLLTPGNCTVIFIDYQPQMFLGVASIDRQVLLNKIYCWWQRQQGFLVCPFGQNPLNNKGLACNELNQSARVKTNLAIRDLKQSHGPGTLSEKTAHVFSARH